MRPGSKARDSPPKRRTRPTSPTRTGPTQRGSTLTPSAFFQETNFNPPPTPPYPLMEEVMVPLYSEPRSFPFNVKQQCWEKAEKVKGRHPDRWRRDPLGNIVFRKLVGCSGCLCHDYDHIIPYSKVTISGVEKALWKIARFCRCEARVNRSKGNQTELSRAELIERSSYCIVSGREMDFIELSAYGDVRRTQDSGGCLIQ